MYFYKSSNFMLIKLKKSNLFIILISFIGTYIVFPVYFEAGLWTITDHSQNWFSLDPSWSLTVTNAFKNGLSFGTEFVLTYGPLGFLTNRLLLGINKYYLLGYDIFLSANFFLFFYYSLRYSQSKRHVLALIIICLICLPIHFGAGTSILLFVIQIFWMNRYLNYQKSGSLIAAALLSLVLLFMKFNTGFISILLLLTTILYSYYHNSDKRRLLLFVSLFFVILIKVLALVFNVSIFQYVKTGFMMVEGFNDLMHLDQEKNLELKSAIFCLLFCIILLIYSLIKSSINWQKSTVIMVLFSLPAYILYKQGFTRADEQHIREFYFYFPLLILAFPQFLNSDFSIDLKHLLFIPVFISCSFAITSQKSILETLINRLFKPDYIKPFIYAGLNTGNFLDSTKNQFPLAIKNKIGSAKVDAYPWNLMELFENKLNISTRPVIQSYTAYTKQLEQLNAAFYDSEKSPTFVLYDFASIDNRYPLFDEPLINLRLFENYDVCDTLQSYGRFKLLLKKKNTPSKITLVPLNSYEKSLDYKIIPKSDIYYEIEIKKTLKGKLQSLFFKPPQLLLQIMNGNKQLFEYRTSINLLESGFFSDRIFYQTSDIFNMYNKTISDRNNKILFYGIRTLNSDCFRNIMTINEYKILTN